MCAVRVQKALPLQTDLNEEVIALLGKGGKFEVMHLEKKEER